MLDVDFLSSFCEGHLHAEEGGAEGLHLLQLQSRGALPSWRHVAVRLTRLRPPGHDKEPQSPPPQPRYPYPSGCQSTLYRLLGMKAFSLTSPPGRSLKPGNPERLSSSMLDLSSFRSPRQVRLHFYLICVCSKG